MLRRLLVVLTLAAGLSVGGPGPGTQHGAAARGRAPRAGAPAPDLPARLTDREFWKLSTEWSEPNGFFRSDNLTSNELLFQHVLTGLARRARPGDVYLGVGPEQNYTYIAA